MINNNLEINKRVKYKPSKIGKVSLVIAIASLIVGLMTILLSVLSIIKGFVMLIVLILSHMVSMIAFIFVLVDVMRFNKINHIKDSIDNKMVLGLIIGIIIGFMWGRIF
jgi:hypothetical protein